MKIFGPAAASVLQAERMAAALLIEMRLTSTVCLCTAGVDLDWGGRTWQGAGFVGSIDEVSESAGDQKPLTFQLSSVPNEFLALALGEPIKGKRCILRLAAISEVDYEVKVADELWRGELELMQVQEGDPNGFITVNATPLSTLFARPKPVRYNDSDQQKLYPGDTCLRFIVSQAAHRDVWPSKEAQKI